MKIEPVNSSFFITPKKSRVDQQQTEKSKKSSDRQQKIAFLHKVLSTLSLIKTKTNKPISLDLEEVNKRYGLTIANTHYRYSGSTPIRDGVKMVIENNNPVYSIDTTDKEQITVTIMTRELVDGKVQEMYKQQPQGFKGILPAGSFITAPNINKLVVDECEEAVSPIAMMSQAIDKFVLTLDEADREVIKKLDIFELLSKLQDFEGLKKDSEVIVGFSNDLSNSQSTTVDQVQQSGSMLIDNCAQISELPVLDGGDGSEGSRKVQLKDINSLIKYSAYQDKLAIKGSQLRVRSAYIALNPNSLLELTPSSTESARIDLLHYLAKIQASILQSTIKEVNENKNDKSSVVLTSQLAKQIEFQGKSSIVKGSVPVTKQSPAYYTSSPDIETLIEHTSTLQIVTIDTENIRFEQ